MNQGEAPLTVDEYIEGFPDLIQVRLREIQAAIKKGAPEAEEAIRYQMPAFILNDNAVYFAGYSTHIGFYPTAAVVDVFRNELSEYISIKGAIRFPIDKPLPADLITRIAEYKLLQNSTTKSL